MENQEQEHLDEAISRVKNQARKKRYQDLEGEVIIKGQLVPFSEQMFFENKLRIKLPKDFQEMDKNMARIKYPSEDRPQIIQTNPLNEVDLTFSLLPEKTFREEIGPLKDSLKHAIAQAHPANEFYLDQTLLSPENLPIGCFSFKSHTMSGAGYNLMFITIIDQQLLLGIFNCNWADQDDWEMIAYQMMLSCQDLTRRKD